jgi:hypothetical protein
MTLQTLTEGIRARHMGATHKRLTEKWNRTGLLRGLQGYNRENMSVLLENQAAQVLKESNALGGVNSGAATGGTSGAIAGFQNVAFPIVRRVFGGLVANELVSIQPMSLPAGLLFYLDYTYGSNQGEAAEATYSAGGSIYNNPVGKGIQSGSTMTGGQYDLLGSGYSKQHDVNEALSIDVSGTVVANAVQFINSIDADTGAVTLSDNGLDVGGTVAFTSSDLTGVPGILTDFDADLKARLDNGTLNGIIFALIPTALLSGTWDADLTMLQDIVLVPGANTPVGTKLLATLPAGIQPGSALNLRRFTKRVDVSSGRIVVAPLSGDHVIVALNAAEGVVAQGWTNAFTTADAFDVSFVADSARVAGDSGDSTVIPTFESTFQSNEPNESPIIPEIDIKIESLSVVATSRKLKAKWSPELAQDLNAYHSLDAEVELTQILSEQIALELDREILNDLLTQANGANLFWSRAPGKFVNKLTGKTITRDNSVSTTFEPGPQFTGTVQEWYSTLVETIIDAGNIIQRKTLRGSANFIVVGTDVATVLESSLMYKPSYSIDGQGQAGAMTIGAEKVGSLSNRFTVYKDPYFPRNRILIGYKGGSYLETGYVYAPYVPLIVTPTMFAPEDFTPRKGVMTRYGKKMVRSDFYGTVTCLDMHII